MKKLPLGIQSFSELIGENHTYVDKTKDIYNLFADGGKYYFLSRPRRFGKSLLISTLAELFSGNKALFKGLWIYDKIEWKEHPVIHIDFAGMRYRSETELDETLNYLIDENAKRYNIQLKSKTFDKRLKDLIIELSQKEQVVLLIDEYDKPIIDFIDQKEIAEANRKTLGNFYSIIKATDKYLKFAFLTGVSKFSKVSVFSGLNNLHDITLSKHFATFLGYTHEELLFHFGGYIERMTEEMNTDRNALVEKIRTWYNGYSWDGQNFVYNPFSILSLFKENSFDNYWFSTGTPSFLIRMIKEKGSDITRFDNLPVSHYAFDSFDFDTMDVIPLLFQTGYLTIKEIYTKRDTKRFRLNYPNKEVRDSFLTYLFQAYTQKGPGVSTEILDRVSEAIDDDDVDRIMQELKVLFASIPYHIFIGEKEAYYHTVIYLALKLAGADTIPEDPTNKGRIDAVLETEQKIYIIEFKLGKGSEADALAQVKSKGYHEKYLNRGKQIVLVGVGLDPEERNIGDYVTENLPA